MTHTLRMSFNLFCCLGLGLLFASGALAQRGASGGHPHPAIPAHTHQVLTSGGASRPSIRRPNGPSGARSINGVPGLGFDYEHLAAVHRNARERRFRRDGFVPIYLWGGYPYGYGYPYDDQSTPEAPPADQSSAQYGDQYADQGDATEEAAPRYPSTALGAQQSANATPEREIENFALVLKDGSQISAVAFTRQGDQVVYITNQGQRQYVAVAKVDAGATTKLNEDRGTPLKLSL